MTDDTHARAGVGQSELELLPPCPWGGQAPDPPPGAQHLRPSQGVDPQAGPRGPGRPPGHRNNRAPDLPDFIHRRYGSPLEHAARFIAQPLAVIAQEIGGSQLDAWYERQAAMEFLARYTLAEPAKPMVLAARVNDAMGQAHLQAALEQSKRLASDPRFGRTIEGEADLPLAADLVRRSLPPRAPD